jgi:hypothetical protein
MLGTIGLANPEANLEAAVLYQRPYSLNTPFLSVHEKPPL